MESSPLTAAEKRVLRWMARFRAARAIRVARALGMSIRAAEQALLSLVGRNLVRAEEFHRQNTPFEPRLCGRRFTTCSWVPPGAAR